MLEAHNYAELHDNQIDLLARALNLDFEQVAETFDSMRKRFFCEHDGKRGELSYGNRDISFSQEKNPISGMSEQDLVDSATLLLNGMVSGSRFGFPRHEQYPDYRERIVCNYFNSEILSPPEDVQEGDMLVDWLKDFHWSQQATEEYFHKMNFDKAILISNIQLFRDFAVFYPGLVPALAGIFSTAGAEGYTTANSNTVFRLALNGSVNYTNAHEQLLPKGTFVGNKLTNPHESIPKGKKKKNRILCSAVQAHKINFAQNMILLSTYAAVDIACELLERNVGDTLDVNEICAPHLHKKSAFDCIVRQIIFEEYRKRGLQYKAYPQEPFDPTLGTRPGQQIDISRFFSG